MLRLRLQRGPVDLEAWSSSSSCFSDWEETGMKFSVSDSCLILSFGLEKTYKNSKQFTILKIKEKENELLQRLLHRHQPLRVSLHGSSFKTFHDLLHWVSLIHEWMAWGLANSRWDLPFVCKLVVFIEGSHEQERNCWIFPCLLACSKLRAISKQLFVAALVTTDPERLHINSSPRRDKSLDEMNIQHALENSWGTAAVIEALLESLNQFPAWKISQSILAMSESEFPLFSCIFHGRNRIASSQNSSFWLFRWSWLLLSWSLTGSTRAAMATVPRSTSLLKWPLAHWLIDSPFQMESFDMKQLHGKPKEPQRRRRSRNAGQVVKNPRYFE